MSCLKGTVRYLNLVPVLVVVLAVSVGGVGTVPTGTRTDVLYVDDNSLLFHNKQKITLGSVNIFGL